MKNGDIIYLSQIGMLIFLPIFLCILAFSVFWKLLLGRIMLGVGLVLLGFWAIFLQGLLRHNLIRQNQRHIGNFPALDFLPTYYVADDLGFYYIDLATRKFGCVRKYNPYIFQQFSAPMLTQPKAGFSGVYGEYASQVYCQFLLNGKVFRIYTLDLGRRAANKHTHLMRQALVEAEACACCIAQLIALAALPPPMAR